MTIVLDHPSVLWALWGVIALAWVDRRAGHRTWGVLSRCVVLTLGVLALAGPAVRWAEVAGVEVHVIDASESIPDAELARAVQLSDARRAQAGVPVGRVAFTERATVEAVPGGPWPAAPPTRGAAGSDLRGALDLAGRLVPHDRPGRVVVYSDGRVPAAADVASALAARGILVVVEPLDPSRAEPGLAALRPDLDQVAPGQTLSATVTVHGGDGGLEADVVLTLDGTFLASAPVRVAPGGVDEVSLTGSVPVDVAPGLVELRATVESVVAEDKPGADDQQDSGPLAGDPWSRAAEGAGGRKSPMRTSVGIRVVPAPRVWVVGDQPATTGPLVRWLRADGVDARAVRVAALPAEVPPLEALVLVDVPLAADHGATPLSRAWADGIQDHVRGGGGLVVVGGEHGYDQGGWTDTALAELLPVRLDPRGRERDDAATLILALDKSGSMAAPVSGADSLAAMDARLSGGAVAGSRFQAVQLAAMASVRALRETDAVGVLAVDTEARWAVPVTSASDQLPVVRTIGKLTAAGGGLHVRAALQEGLTALRQADTPLRHMVVFADAGDVDGRVAGVGNHPLDIVRLLARDDVTISVIAVGPGTTQDLALLEQLALEGGGRFLHARAYGELEALFVAETEQLVGQGIEEAPVQVVPGVFHPALRGVDLGAAPSLLGRNRVKPRADTRIWASDPAGDPILASWRVGLGEVVAVATDLGGGWGRSWSGWSGLPRLWTQTVREVARRTDRDGDLTWRLEDGRVRVAVDVTGGAPTLRWDTAAAEGEVPLALAAPGLWEAEDPVPAGVRGTLTVMVDGEAVAERDVWSSSVEDRWRTPDQAALQALAMAATASPVQSRTLALGPWVLVLAVLLLPWDALTRRRLC